MCANFFFVHYFHQFLYESESKAEDTNHHQLLKDIQHGVKLRKVKTNDKSKPYIEGAVYYTRWYLFFITYK